MHFKCLSTFFSAPSFGFVHSFLPLFVGEASDYIPYPPSYSLLTFLLEYLEHKDLIKYLHMH